MHAALGPRRIAIAMLTCATCALALGSGLPTGVSTAECITYGEPRHVCDLANRTIDESSGLAVSRRTPGVFWTHNDSGDGPVAYAFGPEGEHLGLLRLKRVFARDWEDMASVRRGGLSYLLLADVGDNSAIRRRCLIHVVAEPVVGTKEEPAEVEADVFRTIEFAYEDGPRDCEAVAVDPADGTILLADKLEGGVYALSWRADDDGPQTARRIAGTSVRGVTAMDVSPDGRRAVLLTYGDAFEFVRGPDESWADAFRGKPRRITMPRRRQGEAVAYGADGRSLYLTSEFVPTPLWEVPAKPPAR